MMYIKFGYNIVIVTVLYVELVDIKKEMHVIVLVYNLIYFAFVTVPSFTNKFSWDYQ